LVIMNRVIRTDTPVASRRAPELRSVLWTNPPPRRGPRGRWLVVAAVAVAVCGGVLAVRALRSPGLDAAYGTEPQASGGPKVMVPAAITPSVPGFVSTLRGLTDGAATLTANGAPVEIEPGGSFTMYIPQGTTEIRLVATAADGSTGESVVAVTDAVPAPAYPATEALHVRAEDWANPALRQLVLGLASQGRINAVQLDIKDEAGVVGYASQVPLATTVGAAVGHYDARQALDELHATGVRVIGRVVCFLDPAMSKWAWENGRSDMVVLNASGNAPLDNNYGAAAFSNPASPEVRQYQIDLATEAVGLGFDEILYDYVRRPEGDLGAMQLPGLETAPDVTIARFVADTNAALEGTGAQLGISVFGISATRPEPTAQDMRLLAPHVDYVSPMVYPSHWTSGEYEVADPVRQPAEIVTRSVADFERIVAGSGAAVVPWLQDFSWGSVIYGPAEVRAQIDAARAVGAEGFLLWNPTSQYNIDALDPAQ
jgi:hypothetical protein